MPNAERSTVLLSRLYASPRRGAKFRLAPSRFSVFVAFFLATSSLPVNGLICEYISLAIVVGDSNSQLRPRLTVSRRETFQSSCTKIPILKLRRPVGGCGGL